jgi:hypothetical protein
MDNAADSGVEPGHVHEIVRSLEENASSGKPEDLARNLLVVGPSSAIANLERRTDIQVRDLYQMLSAPMHKATAVGWSWPGSRSSKEPLEEVIRQLAEDGRAVVFRNFDRGPEQKMLSALETILARFMGPSSSRQQSTRCQRQMRRAADGGEPHCRRLCAGM